MELTLESDPNFFQDLKNIVLPEYAKTISYEKGDYIIIVSYNNNSTFTFHLFHKSDPSANINIMQLNIKITKETNNEISNKSLGYITKNHPIMLSFIFDEISPLELITKCQIELQSINQNEPLELRIMIILMELHINSHPFLKPDFVHFAEYYFTNYSISSIFNIQAAYPFNINQPQILEKNLQNVILPGWVSKYMNNTQNHKNIYQIYQEQANTTKKEIQFSEGAFISIRLPENGSPAKNNNVTIKQFVGDSFQDMPNASITQYINEYNLYMIPYNSTIVIHSAFPFPLTPTTIYAVPKELKLIINAFDTDQYIEKGITCANIEPSFRKESDGYYFYLSLVKNQIDGVLYRVKVDLPAPTKIPNALFDKFDLTAFFNNKHFFVKHKYFTSNYAYHLESLTVVFREPTDNDSIAFQASQKFVIPKNYIMPDHFSVAWLNK